MIEVTLDSKKLEKGLAQLLSNATNSRPMMRSIATELESLTEDNFENESFGGERWKQSQRAAAENGKTLQKSGQLAASITSRTGTDFARIGSNKKYAAIHHLGGQAGRGKKLTLPARPYLPISGKGKLQRGAEDNILDIALKALSKGV